MDEESVVMMEPPSGVHPFWRLPVGVTYDDRRRHSPVRRRVRRYRRIRCTTDGDYDDDDEEDDGRIKTGRSTRFSAHTRIQSCTTQNSHSIRHPNATPMEGPSRLTEVTELDQRGLSTVCGSVSSPRDVVETSPQNMNAVPGIVSAVLAFRPKRYPRREESTNSLFENDVIMGPTRPNLRARHKSPFRRIDSVCEKYVKAQLLLANRDPKSSPISRKRSTSSILKRPKTSDSGIVYDKNKSELQRRKSLAPSNRFSETEDTTEMSEEENKDNDEEGNNYCVQSKSRSNSNYVNNSQSVAGRNLSSTVAAPRDLPSAAAQRDPALVVARDSDDELSKSFMALTSRTSRHRERDSVSSVSSDDLDDELNTSRNSEDMCESDAFDTDCEPDVKSEFCQKDFMRSLTRADAEVGHMTYVKACKESQTKPRDKIRKQLLSKKVNLRHGGLLPPEARALAMALKINARVEEVDISHNSLPTDAMCDFLEVMASKRTVTKLNIRGNRMDNEECAKMGNELLNNNDWITHLDMSECVIGDTEIAALAQGIQDNRYIHTLKLSKNKIGLTGALLLGRALGINDAILKLDLSWNQIRGAGAVAVCNCLKKNTTMEWLDLSWNGIGFEGSLALGEAIRINRKLKYLNLENNRINWDCAPYLTKALMGNKTLEVLLIGQNPISMEGCEDIVTALKKTTSSVKTLSFAGIPINTRIALMATDIAKTREFSMDHGGVLTTNDVISGHRVAREDPFTLLIRYLTMMGIRVMDLFRMFDKDNKLLVTRAKFIQGLKRVRVPLDDEDIMKVAKRLQSDKRGCISYQELANTVRNRIREERREDKRLEILTRKKREERKRILQSDKPVTASTNINFLPSLYNMYGLSEKETQSGTFFSPTGFSSSRTSMFTPLPILNSPRTMVGKSAANDRKKSSSALVSQRGALFKQNKHVTVSRSVSVTSNPPKGLRGEGPGDGVIGSAEDSSNSYVSQFKKQQSNMDFMGTHREV